MNRLALLLPPILSIVGFAAQVESNEELRQGQAEIKNIGQVKLYVLVDYVGGEGQTRFSLDPNESDVRGYGGLEGKVCFSPEKTPLRCTAQDKSIKAGDRVRIP